MSKNITILGGNGYIGNRCARVLLKNYEYEDIKINIISRNISENKKILDERVIYIIGDALKPEEFKEILLNSTGVIHSIGTLISGNAENYHIINKETCLRPAKIISDLYKEGIIKEKINFVYISAERGLPFPLSLKFGGYIQSKREAENTLCDPVKISGINPIILKPGFVKDSSDRLWSIPLFYAVNLINYIERIILSRISSSIGYYFNLPAAGIELQNLANYAAVGAAGDLDSCIYSNEEMINNKQKFKID
jgi:nucleoside-diphosphate-sugar epimerase